MRGSPGRVKVPTREGEGGATAAPAEKPRVLFIEYGMGFGGAVISLSELVEGLHQLDAVEPVVLTFQEPEITEGLFPNAEVLHARRLLSYRTREAFEKLVDGTAVLQRTRFLWFKLYALLDALHEWVLSVRLYRVVRREGAEIVHINNGWEVSAVRAARWSGARIVVHGRGLPASAAGPTVARPSVARRFESGKGGVYVAISEAVSESVRAAGVPPERVRTIYNPVSLEPYRISSREREAVRAQWNIAPDKVVAAVFGRVVPWKGQLEFLHAVADIIGECQDLMVMIVGDESDSDGRYMRQVQALASDPPLEGRVVFTGYQKEVGKYFAAADIVVHCSLDPEPFGRVVIEGMATAKAVIAMNEGGPREIITDGEDGLLVSARDLPAVRAALLRLYRNPVLRAELGRNARDTVERRFAPHVIAAQVAECYR